MVRHHLILIALFATLPLAFSCESKEEVERVSKAERRARFVEDSLSLKVAVLPTSDCDAIRLAEELGIYDSLGVKVHLRHYNALSECRYALNHKLVEGAAIDSTLASIIINKDSVQLSLSIPTSLSWKLVSAKKARVLRMSQLVDKTIGADSHGASHLLAEEAIDSILKKKQHSYIVQVEDVNVRYDMLRLGNIDAAVLPEPYASRSIEEGNKLLVDYSNRKQGVVVFRKKALQDERIKKQCDLFRKALIIANDSLSKRK